MADLDQAIALDPAHVPAYLERGDLRRRTGQLDKRCEDYTDAIRIDGRPIRGAFASRSDVAAKRRIGARRWRDHDAAIRLDRKYVMGLIRRGRTGVTKAAWRRPSPT